MPDDGEFVARVAAGDRQAFLHLYDRYAPRVYALALRILAERMAAEEVTQDAFVKLWTRATTFNPARGTLLSWLLTVTRRTALDRLRLEGRRPPVVEPPDSEQGWDDLPDNESGGEEARWRALRFAVADLPGEQRQVIELAFYHGLTHSQIAAHTHIPLGTVKTRLRLGMEKLRHAWLLGEASGDRKTDPGLRDVHRGEEDAV